MVEVRIGASGWYYEHWAGLFYPEDMKPRDWLPHYAGHFDTVEINATFYRQPGSSTIANWLDRTPEDFTFAVKMQRSITHYQRLEGVEGSLERFEKVAKAFGKKLGIVLIQLPPSLEFNPARDRAFFTLLRSTSGDRRYALEARHTSWVEKQAQGLLGDFDIAWCVADSGGRYPLSRTITASYSYVRFHGPGRLYASSYSDEALNGWADLIRRYLSQERDVYVYFNNDFHGYALSNARYLRKVLAASK